LEDQYEESEEAFAEDLPEVPRPPLKLSKEDWLVLDEWMRDYVKKLFDQQRQDFAITDDPAPHLEESVLEEPIHPEAEFETIADSNLDPSKVMIKHFGPVSKELLAKATTRKILYSPASHSFLFTSETNCRETIAIDRDGVDASELIRWVAGGISSTGLGIEQLIHEDGFTFVCFRGEGVRVSFSVGASQSLLSLPIVVVGVDRRSVLSFTDKLHAVLHAPD
jgi:hypothetical protein